MKAPPEDFLYTIDVVITTWWTDGKDSQSAQHKAGHDPKANSTFMPNGTSSKFTNIYRSPRLAGSLPLSCGDSTELFTVIERAGLTGEPATVQ